MNHLKWKPYNFGHPFSNTNWEITFSYFQVTSPPCFRETSMWWVSFSIPFFSFDWSSPLHGHCAHVTLHLLVQQDEIHIFHISLFLTLASEKHNINIIPMNQKHHPILALKPRFCKILCPNTFGMASKLSLLWPEVGSKHWSCNRNPLCFSL